MKIRVQVRAVPEPAWVVLLLPAWELARVQRRRRVPELEPARTPPLTIPDKDLRPAQEQAVNYCQISRARGSLMNDQGPFSQKKLRRLLRR